MIMLSTPVPHLPQLPEFTFRYFRGASDYPGILTIQQSCAQADRSEETPTIAGLSAEYKSAEPFAPSDNRLVVEVNGTSIGYTTCQWWEEQDGTWVYLHDACVTPRWRNQGIEQALLRWTEARLRTIASTHPTHGKAVFGTNATSAENERQLLLLEEGYQEVFSMLEMELLRLDNLSLDNLPLVAPPDPFRITRAEGKAYRLLWDAMQEAYQGRSMFMVVTEEAFQEFVGDPARDTELELVAWNGEQVAGMVFVRVDGKQGIIDECNVRPQYRRRGLATALLTHGLALLHNRGVTSVRLHVRKGNETGAQLVYERLGFSVRKEFLRFRKSLNLLS